MTTPAERTEAMTEPTIAQIAEADRLADVFGLDVGARYEFTAKNVAKLIAHVRREARNAALEDVANIMKLYGPYDDPRVDAIRALIKK